MKPGRRDYNLIGTEHDPIPADEPVFIIRGQDELSEPSVRMYAVLARNAGLWEIERSALAMADEMAKWTPKKRPTL